MKNPRTTRIYSVDSYLKISAEEEVFSGTWLVGLNIAGRPTHRLTPAEARKLARLLIKLSKKPVRRKKAGKK